jgi:hypothetical protein
MGMSVIPHIPDDDGPGVDGSLVAQAIQGAMHSGDMQFRDADMPGVTDKRQRAFLNAFVRTLDTGRACIEAGINPLDTVPWFDDKNPQNTMFLTYYDGAKAFADTMVEDSLRSTVLRGVPNVKVNRFGDVDVTLTRDKAAFEMLKQGGSSKKGSAPPTIPVILPSS